MVRNIQDTNEVLDLHTNGGMICLTKKCEVPLYGQAWFNPKSITNIIIMSEMVDKYHVTFDSRNDAYNCSFSIAFRYRSGPFLATENSTPLSSSSTSLLAHFCCTALSAILLFVEFWNKILLITLFLFTLVSMGSTMVEVILNFMLFLQLENGLL